MMKSDCNKSIKTTILFQKHLLDEIDKLNPFSTRKEFLNQACKAYLNDLKRSLIDKQLSEACREACVEDAVTNDEWEPSTIEGWK